MIDSAPQIPRLYNRYYEIPRNPSSVFTEEDTSSGDPRNFGRYGTERGRAFADVQLPVPRRDFRGDISPSIGQFME
jgi:hypothetical protein